MKDYNDYVDSIQATTAAARSIPVPTSRTEPLVADEKVLLFSPHPDDECITGVLPLRLMRELQKQIINIPVTFGSREDRQAARAIELQDACGYLGWTVHRETDSLAPLSAADVANALQHFQPEIIVMPHAEDWNPRHIWTHNLVLEALQQLPASFACTVIETEFWGAMDGPNLMVEADAETVADLVAATALHVGEVERNPYHLLLPAWMQDNVRRGGELVGGPGSEAPAFGFATLYRIRRWKDGRLLDAQDHGRFVAKGTAALKEVF